MATTTNKKGTEVLGDFTEGFGDVSERYRVVNEKLIESGKKTGNAVLDAAGRGSHPARLGEHRCEGAERVHQRGQRGVRLRCS